MKKMRMFQQKTEAGNEKGFFVSLLIGCIVFFVLGMFLLAIFCFLALMMEDPMRAVPAFALTALLISAYFGGYLCARTYGKKGIVCGVVCALAAIIMIVAFSLSCKLEIRPVFFAIGSPLMLLVSCIAGTFGANRERKAKPKHKIRF